MYRNTLFIFALIVLVSACNTPGPNYSELSVQPTPNTWTVTSSWQFEIEERGKKEHDFLTLELTDEEARSCLSGSWRRALVKEVSFDRKALFIESSKDQIFFPAYEIVGRYIFIQLHAPYCDIDLLLKGAIHDHGAQGIFEETGPFHYNLLGTFSARQSPGP